METLKIPIDIYGVDVTFCYGSNEEFASFIQENYDPDYEIQPMGGWTLEYPRMREVVVFVAETSDVAMRIAIAAHEVTHASWFILDDVRVSVTADNHEALVYLQGYLLRAIHGILFGRHKRATPKKG